MRRVLWFLRTVHTFVGTKFSGLLSTRTCNADTAHRPAQQGGLRTLEIPLLRSIWISIGCLKPKRMIIMTLLSGDTETTLGAVIQHLVSPASRTHSAPTPSYAVKCSRNSHFTRPWLRHLQREVQRGQATEHSDRLPQLRSTSSVQVCFFGSGWDSGQFSE